ncbi:MAG TPA: hypothetical protein PL043_01525 [Methanolinea sp.]|jgi:hypothetical protein|nr:hypothetical protein [Methanolinea sp.]
MTLYKENKMTGIEPDGWSIQPLPEYRGKKELFKEDSQFPLDERRDPVNAGFVCATCPVMDCTFQVVI